MKSKHGIKAAQSVIFDALAKEFPGIEKRLIQGVAYVVFHPRELHLSYTLEALAQELLDDDPNAQPPYSDDQQDQAMLELALETGKGICKNQKLLSQIGELMKAVVKIKHQPRDERKRRKLSKPPEGDHDSSTSAKGRPAPSL